MNLRKYAEKPYKIAVVHGGPGATGSVKLICEELSEICGVLEHLQTETAVDGLLHEFKKVLEENTDEPIILIGHSWGALLIYMFAAKYNRLVKKSFLYQVGLLKKSTMKIYVRIERVD